MIKNRTWKGAKLTKTEIVGLFVAKTTWHNSYLLQMPAAEAHEDMRAWLAEEDGALSEADVWGDAKIHHTLKDLDSWLKIKAGKTVETTKKVEKKAVVKGKAGKAVAKGTAGKAVAKGKAGKAVAKGAAKAKETGKGKEKKVESEEEPEVQPKAKKSHKKKSTTG